MVYNQIQNLRKKKNLSQFEMALKLHMSQSAYAKLENGKTKIDIDRLIEIAKLLHTDLNQLLTYEIESINTFINEYIPS